MPGLLRVFIVVALLVLSVLPAMAGTAADFRYLDLRLPQNSVLDILQDQQGYIWLATGTGLARYDGYRLQTFLHNPDDPNSLSQNLILKLLQDSDGNIWIATNNGISRYRDGEGFRRYLFQPGATEQSSSHRFETLYIDPNGQLWAGSVQGLFWYNAAADQFIAVTLPAAISATVHKIRWQDKDNSLWFSGSFGLARLQPDTMQTELLYGQHWVSDWLHDNQQRLWLSIGNPHIPGSSLLLQFASVLPNTTPLQYQTDVYSFRRDSHGQHWGYGHNSLFRILPDGQLRHYQLSEGNHLVYGWLETADGQLLVTANKTVYRYRREADDFIAMTIAAKATFNNVDRLFQTSDGTVLLSTGQSGLYQWAPYARKFQHIIAPEQQLAAQLPFMAGLHVVRLILEEPEQLWLGSGSGHLLRARPVPQHGQTDADWQSYLTPDRMVSVHSLYRTGSGRLVLGKSDGLYQWDDISQQFNLSPLQAVLPQNISHWPAPTPVAQVLDIKQDQHCLWLATNAGLGCADADASRMLRWYDSSQYPAFDNNYLWRIYIARDGALWLASTQGLLRFNPQTAELLQFQHDPANANSLAHNWVHGIWQSADNEFWLATREGGLNRLLWQPGARPQWQRFGIKDGLPTEVLYGILGDDAGMLWLSSSQGIFRFNPKDYSVRAYQLEDGLQSDEFNFSVSHIGPSGRFYFGGVSGINAFFPEQVQDNPVAPRLQLSGLSVNDQPFNLAASGQPLPLQLQLSHQQNHLAFDVLALHYADPARIQYAWQLQGADNDWVQAGTGRQARYGALPPGKYQFWLKAANPDGVWSEPQLMLSLQIKPHPLLSLWAYIGYALLVLAAIWRYKVWRDQTEAYLQSQITQGIGREAALQQHLRLQFEYTAHEMCTPLMRLGTQLSRSHTALSSQNLDAAQLCLQKAETAQQELQRLIKRQLELEELKLQQGDTAVHLAARPVIDAELQRYRPYAEENGQQLSAELSDATLYAMPGVLELVCSNLLGNAIKYTPPGGQIRLQLGQQPPWLQLTVTDNGPGIPLAEQQKVFLRHYRLAGQQHIAGSGEGLFLIKSCVENAGGQIELHSEPGQGCCFTVRLPCGDASQISTPRHAGRLQPLADTVLAAAPLPPRHPQRGAIGSETVLLVEDDPGLRDDITDLLTLHYHCLVADSGATGLQLARQHLPDIIISDVMMEQKDSGFSLLAELKSHIDTSHIPVVLLTALNDEQNRYRGMRYQADAYLSKPTSEQAILASLETLLNQCWRLGEHIRRALHSASQQPEQLTEAECLNAKLQGIFQHIYSSPNARVEDIAAAFGKSRSVLQGMVKQHLATDLKESLRAYRFQQMLSLLQQKTNTCSIEQIAEQCGFGSMRSVQHYFKKRLNMSPQQYRDGQRPLNRPAIE